MTVVDLPADIFTCEYGLGIAAGSVDGSDAMGAPDEVIEGIAITEGRSEGIPAKGLNALVGLWVEGSAEESVGSLVWERGCL